MYVLGRGLRRWAREAACGPFLLRAGEGGEERTGEDRQGQARTGEDRRGQERRERRGEERRGSRGEEPRAIFFMPERSPDLPALH